jgi:chemotaxis protein CheC
VSKIVENYEDVLREIGNIGSGNALTSLSQMMGTELELGLPSCQVVTRETLGQLFAQEQASLYAGVSMQLEGEMQCLLALLLNKEFTSIVLKQVAGEEVTDVQHMTEMQKSAVCEIGNIMCNSYITAFSQLMGRSMDLSVPSMAVDVGEKVLASFLKQYVNSNENLLFVGNTFYYRKQKLASHILFHPTKDSVEEILAHLNQ